MVISYNKTTLTEVNPFDGISETFIKVDGVVINNVSVKEVYVFLSVTTDAEINGYIESDMLSKGY